MKWTESLARVPWALLETCVKMVSFSACIPLTCLVLLSFKFCFQSQSAYVIILLPVFCVLQHVKMSMSVTATLAWTVCARTKWTASAVSVTRVMRVSSVILVSMPWSFSSGLYLHGKKLNHCQKPLVNKVDESYITPSFHATFACSTIHSHL